MAASPAASSTPSNSIPSNGIYLSREGKVFGPYTREELEQFRENGEIAQYAWIWDGSVGKWASLHPEPAKPAPLQPVGSGEQPATEPKAQPKAKTRRAKEHQIVHAIFFDSQRMMSGTIDSIDENGAVVSCASEFAVLVPFRKGQKLTVSLVDEATGECENLSALVLQCAREGRKIVYRIQWEKAPELLGLS